MRRRSLLVRIREHAEMIETGRLDERDEGLEFLLGLAGNPTMKVLRIATSGMARRNRPRSSRWLSADPRGACA